MRCLLRNRRLIYLCTAYQDGNIRKFNKPLPIKLNYQSTNSDSDLIALGLEYPKYMRIKADLKYADVFHPKDRVYIKNEPNEEQFDVLCKDADYEVDSDPRVSLNVVEVMLKRLSGKE